MSATTTKKINSIVSSLISFSPQLNRIERAPKMILLENSASKKQQKTLTETVVGNFVSKLPSFTSLVSAQTRVKWLVADLENVFTLWLNEWKQLVGEIPLQKFRKASSPHSSVFDETPAPLTSLTLVYQYIIDLLFSYQFYLKYVDPVTLKILPQISELFQCFSLKSTSPHWFHLPTVRIKPVELKKAPGKNSLEDDLKILRHPVDDRFDRRELHTHGQLYEYAMEVMDRFCKCQDPKHENEESEGSSELFPFFAASLTATYPYVPASRALVTLHNQWKSNNDDGKTKTEEMSPVKYEENEENGPQKLVLLNDPNNDGYLLILGSGWAVGAVVDGSGAGSHARLAANLFLAILYEMTVGEIKNNDDGTGFTKFNLRQTPWKTSHDCMNFLEKVCREAQKVMVETEECGATTIIAFTLTEMIPEESKSYHETSRVFKNKFGPTDPVFILNYVIAGDTFGIAYDSLTQEWKDLNQPPHIHEGVRLNASITPGGLGKHHGSRDVIYGAYLWPEYLKMKGEDDYDRSAWVEFHRRTNNIHFGQLFMAHDEFIVLASDGLGDTLDPIQIFPKPNLMLGLDSYDSWQRFVKEYPQPKNAMVEMKEMIIKSVLASTMCPFGSDETPDTKIDADLGPLPTAKQILDACVKHAMEVTKKERELYFDPEFLQSSRWEKHAFMEKRILEWIDKHWPKRFTVGSPLFGRPFALPGLFVPYAKIDHLGIQVVQAKLIRKTHEK